MDSQVELKNQELFSTRRQLIIARFFLFVTQVRKIGAMINDLNLKAWVFRFFFLRGVVGKALNEMICRERMELLG